MLTITLNEAARAEADAQKAERHSEGYFTLIEVIDDLALQLCLHAEGKATLREDFLKAVRMDKLTTRRRHTALEYKPETVRDYYDLVTLCDVNAWLEKQGAPYRWSPAPPLIAVPHKSPRDYKPWETLPQALDFIPGVYMYEQVAREIADAQGWSDSKLEAFQTEMAIDIKAGVLQLHSIKTGLAIEPDKLGEMPVVTAVGVNKWLEKRGAEYRWSPHSGVIADASDGDEVNPGLQWWQESYDIPELWQNIGARLHSQKRLTSNTAIAKEIEKRINEIQKGKGLNRVSPNWDTIRGKLYGWKWKTD